MSIECYNLDSLNSGLFRMVIIGNSESGKTYTITNNLWGTIKDKYDVVFVLSTQYNFGKYKVIGNKLFFIDIESNENKNIKDPIIYALRKIIKQMSKGLIGFEKTTGKPVYKCTTLIIFDDVVDKKFSKSDEMLNLFSKVRNYQGSLIYSTQFTHIVLSPSMLNNTTHTILLPCMGDVRRDCISKVKSYLKYKTDKEGTKEATSIYEKYIDNKMHGKLLLTTKKIYYI